MSSVQGHRVAPCARAGSQTGQCRAGGSISSAANNGHVPGAVKPADELRPAAADAVRGSQRGLVVVRPARSSYTPRAPSDLCAQRADRRRGRSTAPQSAPSPAADRRCDRMISGDGRGSDTINCEALQRGSVRDAIDLSNGSPVVP